MNKILITSLLLMLTYRAVCHDMKLSQFTVHIKAGQLMCDGRIDKEDLQAALGGSLSPQKVENYLRDHLRLKFDGTDVSLEAITFEISKNWVSVHFGLKAIMHKPASIEVLNTVLIAEVEDQDNIMRFILHDNPRTFRLNEKRKIISFNYKNG